MDQFCPSWWPFLLGLELHLSTAFAVLTRLLISYRELWRYKGWNKPPNETLVLAHWTFFTLTGVLIPLVVLLFIFTRTGLLLPYIITFILYKFTRTIPFTLYACRFAWLARHGAGLLVSLLTCLLSLSVLLLLLYEAVGVVRDQSNSYSYHSLTLTYAFIYGSSHWTNEIANLAVFPSIMPCLYILLVNAYQTTYFSRNPDLDVAEERTVVSQAKSLRPLSIGKILIILLQFSLVILIYAEVPGSVGTSTQGGAEGEGTRYLCGIYDVVRFLNVVLTDGALYVLLLIWHSNAYHRANPMQQEDRGVYYDISGEEGSRFEDRYSLLSAVGVLGPQDSNLNDIERASSSSVRGGETPSNHHRSSRHPPQRWRSGNRNGSGSSTRNGGTAAYQSSPYRPPADPRLRMERLRKRYRHVEISLNELHLEKSPFAVGGSGQCYKGVFGGTEIVAKMICDDLDEFDIEVENLLKLRHPHVVRFYGVCLDVDWLYIITQFVPSTLEALIHKESFDFLTYARQLCSTIAYLHHKEIVHRDLKPGNLLVDNRGGAADRLMVCDLGLATFSKAHNRTKGYRTMTQGIGTPIFSIPPESINNEPGVKHDPKKIDIFSLGFLLWYMWFKELPLVDQDMNEVQLLIAIGRGLRPRIRILEEGEVDRMQEEGAGSVSHDEQQTQGEAAAGKEEGQEGGGERMQEEGEAAGSVSHDGQQTQGKAAAEKEDGQEGGGRRIQEQENERGRVAADSVSHDDGQQTQGEAADMAAEKGEGGGDIKGLSMKEVSNAPREEGETPIISSNTGGKGEEGGGQENEEEEQATITIIPEGGAGAAADGRQSGYTSEDKTRFRRPSSSSSLSSTTASFLSPPPPPPPLPPSPMPQILARLIKRMWHNDPRQRPDIDEVVAELDAIIAMVSFDAVASEGGGGSGSFSSSTSSFRSSFPITSTTSLLGSRFLRRSESSSSSSLNVLVTATPPKRTHSSLRPTSAS